MMHFHIEALRLGAHVLSEFYLQRHGVELLLGNLLFSLSEWREFRERLRDSQIVILERDINGETDTQHGGVSEGFQ